MAQTASILDRIGIARELSEDHLADEHDAEGAYRAFGITRQTVGYETMLDFVLRSGNHESIAYAHLYQMAFNPSDGIVLQFTEHLVTIHGLRLRELYRHLRSHRVAFICEADSTTSKITPADQPLVTSIQIRKRDSV